jgi:hypothetical protein
MMNESYGMLEGFLATKFSAVELRRLTRHVDPSGMLSLLLPSDPVPQLDLAVALVVAASQGGLINRRLFQQIHDERHELLPELLQVIQGSRSCRASVLVWSVPTCIGLLRDTLIDLAIAGIGVELRVVHERSEVRNAQNILGDVGYVLLVGNEPALKSMLSDAWLKRADDQSTVVMAVGVEVQAADVLRFGTINDIEGGVRLAASYLLSELEPVPELLKIKRSASVPQLHKRSRRDIRLVATACLSDTSLDALLWDLDLDPGSLVGASLHQRVLSLMRGADTQGMLPVLLDWLVKECSRCVAYQMNKLGGDEPTIRE